MNKLLFFFLIGIASLSCKAQDFVSEKIQEIPLTADRFVGVDKFDNYYYIIKNTLHRKNERKTVEYRELQLGEIFNVDLLNPLRISVFYKEANTVVILDNRLNELQRVSFDRLTRPMLVDFCTTANDQSLWVFNADLQELEIFNYNRKTSELQTLPVSDEILNQKSNFNFCWLHTPKSLIQYNIYGSLIQKIEIELEHIDIYKNRILLIDKNKNAYYFNAKAKELTTLNLPKIEFQDVHLNDEKLYLYNGEMIAIFQITPNS